ncbi:MAG: hypothetical protein CMJ53_03380 [Planctomycetaceae bacterium]|nr:hypothetical protein [Planctomycetaceae bacterium]
MLAVAQTSTSTGTGSAFSELWPWLVALVILILVGGAVIGIIRKWMRGSDDSEQIGFSLGDLRTLHREGKLSAEELKQAESKIISRIQSGISPETRAELDRIRPQKQPSQPEPPENTDLDHMD